MQNYSKQINDRAEEDQRLRKSKSEWGKVSEYDKKSTKFLENLILELGFPSISKVGKKASRNAWLLAQHSPSLDFQKKFLELTLDNEGDVDPRNKAYLIDRIALFENRPQRYGTQLTIKDKGKFELHELENEDDVDKLREKVGLEPLQDYLKSFENN